MEQYRPHKSATFEGYYTRFTLPSGTSLIYILCTIPNATKHGDMALLTSVSPTGQIWQQTKWLDSISFDDIDLGRSFRMVGTSSEDGAEFSMTIREGKESVFVFKTAEADFSAKTTDHVPWSSRTSSPESWLSYLPLPLHWHVHSLASNAQVQMRLPDSAGIPQKDLTSTGTAHAEKNWANAFPSAHMWLQARKGKGDNASGIALAGGKILGMQAFLIGYRNGAKGIELDFRPPFALKVLGLGPFMTYGIDWENRAFSISAQDFTRKLVVKASAPKGTFYPLCAPYETGHKENWLNQSLQANIEVEVFESSWGLGPWTKVSEEKFEGGALEFGGEFFPLRGSDKKRN